eukprot:15335289-Ditylum_brightwellii.AAC.1
MDLLDSLAAVDAEGSGETKSITNQSQQLAHDAKSTAATTVKCGNAKAHIEGGCTTKPESSTNSERSTIINEKSTPVVTPGMQALANTTEETINPKKDNNATSLQWSKPITRKQLFALSGGGGGNSNNPLKLLSPVSYTGGKAIATKKINEVFTISHICIKEKCNIPLPKCTNGELILMRIQRRNKSSGHLKKSIPDDATYLVEWNDD